jgi:hypothetical protein
VVVTLVVAMVVTAAVAAVLAAATVGAEVLTAAEAVAEVMAEAAVEVLTAVADIAKPHKEIQWLLKQKTSIEKYQQRRCSCRFLQGQRCSSLRYIFLQFAF